MQAIVTKYLSQTEHNPSRMVARTEFARVVVPYDHGASTLGNHAIAAAALIAKMNWGALDRWRGGQTHDGSYSWVCGEETIADIVKRPT